MGIWQNHLGNWARCNLKMTLDFQEESPLQERDAVRRVRLQHGVRVRAAAAQEGAPRHGLRLCLRRVRHGLHQPGGIRSMNICLRVGVGAPNISPTKFEQLPIK